MTASTVDVTTHSDGTLVIQPHGVLEAEDAIGLRRALVQAIRHTRPIQLVLDLADVPELDPINLGALAAACHLGDDHQVAVFLDHSSAAIAVLLTAAGVPTHRIRYICDCPGEPNQQPSAARSDSSSGSVAEVAQAT